MPSSFSISTYAFPINHEQDSMAIVTGVTPRTGTFIDGDGDSNVFKQGPDASAAFRYAYPGEVSSFLRAFEAFFAV